MNVRPSPTKLTKRQRNDASRCTAACSGVGGEEARLDSSSLHHERHVHLKSLVLHALATPDVDEGGTRGDDAGADDADDADPDDDDSVAGDDTEEEEYEVEDDDADDDEAAVVARPKQMSRFSLALATNSGMCSMPTMSTSGWPWGKGVFAKSASM